MNGINFLNYLKTLQKRKKIKLRQAQPDIPSNNTLNIKTIIQKTIYAKTLSTINL